MNKHGVVLAVLLLVLGTTACAPNRLDAVPLSKSDTLPAHSSRESFRHNNVAVEPPVCAEFVKTQVAFAPWDDVEGMIVKALDKAREQILVQAYVLSNKEVIAALLRARARSIDVQVLVDRNQMQRRASRVAELVRAGIPVHLERHYHSAHNKLMVIDPASASDATVITGSMNYSDTSPYRNAENVLIISGASHLVQAYAKNWQRHAEQAAPYQAAYQRK